MIKNGKKEKGRNQAVRFYFTRKFTIITPNINSIITAQSPSVTAYAISKEYFKTRTIPESYVVLRDIPEIEFARS